MRAERLIGGSKAAAPQQQPPNIKARLSLVATTPPLLKDVRSSELWRKRGAVDVIVEMQFVRLE